jgi:hypothetical protein
MHLISTVDIDSMRDNRRLSSAALRRGKIDWANAIGSFRIGSGGSTDTVPDPQPHKRVQ